MCLHNEQVTKSNTAQNAGSPTLRDFHEGDIAYCHFPSKTLIAELGLQTRKIKMNFIGPLYIYLKFDKFQFVLSTIDDEVIKQLLHVAWLKKGLLKLPNGKIANNINDYLKYKQELQSTLQTATPPVGNEAANMQASADSSSLMHVDLFKRPSAWCTSPQIIYLSTVGARNLSSQSSYFCPITSLEAKTSIFPEFLPQTQMDLAEYSDITKSRYKVGKLEVFTHLNVINKYNRVWQEGPASKMLNTLETLSKLKVKITGSEEAYVKKLLKIL